MIVSASISAHQFILCVLILPCEECHGTREEEIRVLVGCNPSHQSKFPTSIYGNYRSVVSESELLRMVRMGVLFPRVEFVEGLERWHCPHRRYSRVYRHHPFPDLWAGIAIFSVISWPLGLLFHQPDSSEPEFHSPMSHPDFEAPKPGREHNHQVC
jgi:hypothetical protein